MLQHKGNTEHYSGFWISLSHIRWDREDRHRSSQDSTGLTPSRTSNLTPQSYSLRLPEVSLCSSSPQTWSPICPTLLSMRKILTPLSIPSIRDQEIRGWRYASFGRGGPTTHLRPHSFVCLKQPSTNTCFPYRRPTSASHLELGFNLQSYWQTMHPARG